MSVTAPLKEFVLKPAANDVCKLVLVACAWLLATGNFARATPAIHPCSAIAADAPRLACFDQAFPRAGSPQASDSTASAATGPDSAVQASRFGLPAPAPRPGSVLEGLEAKVVSVGRLSRGERLFQLDNGQRWAETNAEARGNVAPGDTVRIERAAFGSFLLVTPSRVGLRVRRLQ